MRKNKPTTGPQRGAAKTSRPSRAGTRQRTARPRCQDPELPTRLERETLLTPLWVAESVLQEVERFLQADLSAGFAKRLAARAHYLYPRHAHFRKVLNRPGNHGRENLRMFMRHWTAGWLKRAKSPLFKHLPRSFALGQPLPAENFAADACARRQFPYCAETAR